MSALSAPHLEQAAQRAGRYAFVGVWVIGVAAIVAWYANALDGFLPHAAQMGSKIGAVEWAAIARRQLEINTLFQLGLFSAACVLARWHSVRGTNAAWLIFTSAVALFTTAFPWLLIQGTCAVWEPVVMLPALVVLRASDGKPLRFTLALALALFLVAQIAGLQPALVALVLPTAIVVLSLMESETRFHRLLTVRFIDDEATEPKSGPEISVGDGPAFAPGRQLVAGVVVGVVIFVCMLPAADSLIATMPHAPNSDGSPLGTLMNARRPLAGENPLAGDTTTHSRPGVGNGQSAGGTGNGSATGGPNANGNPDGNPNAAGNGSEHADPHAPVGVLGFAQDVSFGDQSGGVTGAYATDGTVFTVEFIRLGAGATLTDPAGLPSAPQTPEPPAVPLAAWPGRRVWQTDALVDYANARWSGAARVAEVVRLDADDFRADGWVEHPEFAVGDEAVVYRYRLYPISGRICPLVTPVGAVRAPAMALSAEGVFRFAGDISRTGVKYDVIPGRFANAAQAPPSGPSPAHLAMPPEVGLAPEFAAWVESLREPVMLVRDADVTAAALFIAGSFTDGFVYDLTPDLDPEADPNLELLRKRRGYCQHYASLFVLGCRAFGIPARLAVGFAGGEFDAGTGRMKVTGRDAHAWGQIFVPGAGWVDVDPLELSGVPEEPSDGGLRPVPTPDPGPDPPEMPDPPENRPSVNRPENRPPVENRPPPVNRPPGNNRPPTGNVPPTAPPDPPVNAAPPDPPPTRPSDPDFPDPPDFDPTAMPPAAGSQSGPTGGPDAPVGPGNGAGTPTGSANGPGDGPSPAQQPGVGDFFTDAPAIGAKFGDRLRTIGTVVGVALLAALVWLFARRRADQSPAAKRRAMAGQWELLDDDLEIAWQQVLAMTDDRARVIAAWHLWERVTAANHAARGRSEPASAYAARVAALLAELVGPDWQPRLESLAGRFDMACYGPWAISRTDGEAAVADAKHLTAAL